MFDPEAGTKLTASNDPKGGVLETSIIAHAEQIGDVVAAAKERREPAINGREARRAVEVILAIYESSQNGTVVKLK